MCIESLSAAIAFIFGMWGNIADITMRPKFYVNRFRGFTVPIPPIFPILIGLAGRPYNSVSMTVLHCDKTSTLTKLVYQLVDQKHLYTLRSKQITSVCAYSI